MTRPEADLAVRVRAGERPALEEAYQLYGGAVKALARKVLRNDDLADDVVQDTFVSFWKSADRFDPAKGSLRSFLLTIAHRRAVDIVRSEEARRKREETTDEPLVLHIEDEVWAMDLAESVRAAVGALPPAERQAIGLAYFGGMSYVEVSRRLSVPEGTIKSRIRSGMAKLAVTLKEDR